MGRLIDRIAVVNQIRAFDLHFGVYGGLPIAKDQAVTLDLACAERDERGLKILWLRKLDVVGDRETAFPTSVVDEFAIQSA